MTEAVDDSAAARPPKGMRQRAMRGVAWTALEKWSVRLSTLVGFVILGNLLDPEDFGVVALAMAFIGILTVVAEAGFGAYLLQTQRLTHAVTSTAFFTTVAMAVVLAGALAASAEPIASALGEPDLGVLLPALSVVLVVAGLSSVPAMLLRRDLRFKELAVRQIGANVLSVVVAVGLAFGGAGVWALVGQTLVRNVVALVVLWATSGFRPRRAFDRAEARAMVSYGAKSVLVQLGNELRNKGEVFLIGALAGTVALGYWTIAGRLVGVLTDVCTSIISSVAHPVFARLQDDGRRLARALGTATAMGALVTVPVLVGMSLVSEDVVPAVFGSQWAPAAAVATWLALRSLVRALSGFNRSALLATGHPGAELVVTVVLLVLQLGVVVVLSHDLVLLAVALTALMALGFPIRALMLRRLFGVPWSTYAQAAAILLAGGVAALAVVVAEALLDLEGFAYVALALGLSAAVYAGVVLLVARSTVREVRDTVGSSFRRRSRRSAAPVGGSARDG